MLEQATYEHTEEAKQETAQSKLNREVRSVLLQDAKNPHWNTIEDILSESYLKNYEDQVILNTIAKYGLQVKTTYLKEEKYYLIYKNRIKAPANIPISPIREYHQLNTPTSDSEKSSAKYTLELMAG